MLLSRAWTWVALLALFGGCRGCQSCTPDLPDDTDDSSDTGDTGDEDTGDTGEIAEPLCDVPEVEPNNTGADATPLPMEQEGCGFFESVLDLDYWDFTLEREGWLQVRVDARTLGSFAHPQLLVESEVSGESAAITYAGSEDALLLFPALPDDYTALLVDDGGQGGEEYFYEIVASQAKEPLYWSLDEVEDNDTIGGAQELESGDELFGFIGDNRDQDWYRVDVPAGKHTLILDIDAWEHGSAARTKIVVYRGDRADEAEVIERFVVGEEGWEPDPWGEVSSPGDETLWLQIQDKHNQSGRTCWYRLEVELEAS